MSDVKQTNETRGLTSPQHFGTKTKLLISVGILGTISLVGAMLAVYFLLPNAHSWIHTHLLTPKLSLGEGLLKIGVPILVAGSVPLIVYAFIHRHGHPTMQKTTDYVEGKLKCVYPQNNKWIHSPKFKRSFVALGSLGGLALTFLALYFIGLAHPQLTLSQAILSIGIPSAGLVGGGYLFTSRGKKMCAPMQVERDGPVYDGL